MARVSDQEIAREENIVARLIADSNAELDSHSIWMRTQPLLGRSTSERTVRRRLQQLAADGRIRRIGSGAASRYAGLPAARVEDPKPTDANHSDISSPPELPVSPAGDALRALVRKPLDQRAPVGYREQLLRDYVPGTHWFLPEPLRAKLHALGRTAADDRPAGTFARDIFERLLVDFAWSSSRLEGNTYSRIDAKNLIERGVRAEGKDASEAQMILNHKRAIELLVEQADTIAFNRYTLFNLHASLAENLVDDVADEGRLRYRLSGVTGTTFVPLSTPQNIEELFDLFLSKASAITDPFEQAFFALVHIPYLQPFSGVNKRTSRLAANIPLIKRNLCPISFVDVPERDYVEATLAVYEHANVKLLRDVFAWAYERSCAEYKVKRESLGEPEPIRLRYRTQLADVVRIVVTDREEVDERFLQAWAERANVASADRKRFVATAVELLLGLHEGAIARYGIGLADYERWRAG